MRQNQWMDGVSARPNHTQDVNMNEYKFNQIQQPGTLYLLAMNNTNTINSSTY